VFEDSGIEQEHSAAGLDKRKPVDVAAAADDV
jgi:hypothetical protein